MQEAVGNLCKAEKQGRSERVCKKQLQNSHKNTAAHVRQMAELNVTRAI